MSESIWEELARSPLDPDPDEQSSIAAWLAPAALAVIAGILLGFLYGNGSSEPVPTTILAADTTTTDTAAPPPPNPIIPDGYIEISGIGLRAIAAYSQGGNLYVVVSQAARSDRDPLDTSSLYLAEWVLTGDGIAAVASRAINSIVSPGVNVVEFPGVTALPLSSPELVVREATEMLVRAGCNGCGAISADTASGEIALDRLQRPHSLTAPLLIPVGEGITLSVDLLDITNDWGYVEWHTIGVNDAILRVVFTVTFDGTDDPDRDGINPTQLVPAQFFGISQQRQTAATPEPFTRQGAVGLDRAGELISETNQPTSLVLEWSVEWQHPVGDPITLPLVDLTDLGMVD